VTESEPVITEASNASLNSASVQPIDPGWRLKLVVIVSGAVLMALEITGSRVLATHFGSSIYVWGAIIGVFLAALAGGYYSGGMLADRKPTFFLLNLILLAAGCWLLVIPFYANWLCRAVRYVNPGERLNPLIATVLLFGGPSVLLGMVSPFAVRLAARTVENIGNLSGRLYALSTVGSIAGTLISSFWLIPAFGVRTLLSALGACLVLLPLIVLTKSRHTAFLFAPIVLLLAGAVYVAKTRVEPRPAHQEVRYEGDSAYHHILVVDDLRTNTRYLQFNNQVESAIDLNPPYETRAAYTDAFQLARIFQPKLERLLIIGGGGGVGARKFISDDPNVVVDLVEIDHRVIDIGYRFFYLTPGPRLRIHNDDGRSFVRRTKERYDLVVLDAYTIGGQIPFHLTTQEFMREVKAVLKPGGVVLANINGTLEGPRSQILRAEYKTLASVFGGLYVFPLPREVERGQNKVLDPMLRRNVILIATDDSTSLTKDSIVSQAESLYRNGMVQTRTFLEDARNFLTTPLSTTDVPLLTDDYAPVDTMLF
jgi:spermidine synthase